MGQAKMPKAPTGLALGLEAKNAPTLIKLIFFIPFIIINFLEEHVYVLCVLPKI